jgi:hypothetical protein
VCCSRHDQKLAGVAAAGPASHCPLCAVVAVVCLMLT